MDWRDPEEMDTSRRNYAHVRLKNGKVMKAIWAPYQARGCDGVGGGIHRVTAWLCEDNQVRGLYDVVAYSLIDSLPTGSGPNGERTDAEIMADYKSEPEKLQ